MSGGDSGDSGDGVTYSGQTYSFDQGTDYWSQFVQDAGLNQNALSEYTSYKALTAAEQEQTRMYIEQMQQGKLSTTGKNFLRDKGIGTDTQYLTDISTRYAEFSAGRSEQAAARAAYIAASNEAGAGRAGTILTQQINETSKTILGSSGGAPVTILGSK